MANISADLVQYRGLFFMAFIMGIGSTFQYGYQISVLNSPSPFIKQFINESWMRRHETTITQGTHTLIWSLTVSVFSIGCLIGSVSSGYLSGKLGKKKCMLYNTFLPLINTVLMGLSQTVGLFELIIVGRFLCGIYVGLGLNIHAQYIGESAPRKLLGFLNCLAPMFVTLGKLCGQIVGIRELFGTELMWPYILVPSGITSLVQLITLPLFPETPHYLLQVKGDKEACVKALKQLWGDRDHQAEIEEMIEQQRAQKKTGNMGILELLKDPSHRWQLYSMIGLILTMQLSGANAIYFYSYDVFRAANFPPDKISYVSIGVGAFEFVSAMVCSLLIEHFGRKFLMLGGFSLMSLILGLLTVTLSLQDSYLWMPYCSVALVFSFIFVFGAGPAGSIFTTCVEIFAQAPRVPALAVSGVFSWVGLYILGMIFPYLVGTLGHFCFLLFIAVMLISSTLAFFIVPETKGKSIAQISQEFNKFNFRRQHRKNLCEDKEYVLSTRL
uniref:Solute carrier family 2, facilitated glucose transporter member 5 n=1 Tax=Xenopus tropicalis TaxID=8364 RepID=A0A6I8T1I3_XENTR|nr:solute carrier family 2, facilitated glucose transporter member 11-like 2 [Xenopus tropicalis]